MPRNMYVIVRDEIYPLLRAVESSNLTYTCMIDAAGHRQSATPTVKNVKGEDIFQSKKGAEKALFLRLLSKGKSAPPTTERAIR